MEQKATSADYIKLNTLEILDNKTNSKYQEIWKRAHIRILTSIRISKLMKSIKVFGPETIASIDIENVSDVFKRHDNLLYYSMTQGELENFPKLLFHPNKGVKVYWNLSLGLCLIYTATVTPFLLAFVTVNEFDKWSSIDTFLTGIFMIDVLMTLNTAYIDKDSKLIINRWKYL